MQVVSPFSARCTCLGGLVEGNEWKSEWGERVWKKFFIVDEGWFH